MSLRARLTLIYGVFLAVVFVGLGFGAEQIIQSRFSAQAKSALTSAANRAEANATLIQTAKGRFFEYHLLSQQSPFASVYLEIVDGSGNIISKSTNLQSTELPTHLMWNGITGAIKHRQSSSQQLNWRGNLFDIYITPMPELKGPLKFLGSNEVDRSALVVAKSESDTSHALEVFNAALFSGEAVVWVLAVLVTWLVSGSALRPISSITQRAAAIADTSDFAGRVPVDTHTAELERLARTFNRMLESLQNAFANQQRFLADASHELRTPLTVLKGNLHYLEDAPDAPQTERDDALHAARMEADRMGALVSDLLALSQADAGYGIQQEPVELDAVVIEGYRRIQTRERALHGTSPTQIRLGRLDEVVVDGDRERLLQLVVILLDNAVKYTPQGGTIDVELSADDGRNRICVTDTGPGISDEDRDHVFERFYRARRVHSVTEGSGLGLPIAKWIAETHGGDISFVSEAGKGTTFTVTLPVRSGQPAIAWD